MPFVHENVKVELFPGTPSPIVYLSENDVGDTVVFELVYKGQLVNIPSGSVVKFKGTKKDGLGFTVDSSNVSGNVVSFVVSEDMTSCSGVVEAEISITLSNNKHGTCNVVLIVEKNPHSDGTQDGSYPQIVSEMGQLVEQIIGDAETASNAANTAVAAKNSALEIQQDVHQYTASAINNWLDDHPEATTTVQDGSLTYKKLVTGTMGFVTPEMFGAVGDGVTDDTTAIENLFNNDGIIIFDQTKEYRVSGPITVSSNTIVCNASLIFDSQTVTTACFMIDRANNVYLYNVRLKSTNDKAGEVLPDFPNWNNCNSSNLTGFYIRESDNVTIDSCTLDCIARLTIIKNFIDGYSNNIIYRNIICKGLTYTGASLQWVKKAVFSNVEMSWIELAYPKVHALYFSKNCNEIFVENVNVNSSVYMSNILQFGNFSDVYDTEDDIKITVINCNISGGTPLTFKHRNAKIKFINCVFTHSKFMAQSGLSNGDYIINIYKAGVMFDVSFEQCEFIVDSDIQDGIYLMGHIVTDSQSEKIKFSSCTLTNIKTISTMFVDNLELTFKSCSVDFKNRFITALRNEKYENVYINVYDCILDGTAGDGILSTSYDTGLNITFKNTIAKTVYYGEVVRNAHATNICKFLGCYFYGGSGSIFSNNTNFIALSSYFNDVSI